MLYFSATSENAVYAVVLLNKTNAEVKVFCDQKTINIATGAPVGGALVSPDNLAIDADGKIYVVEDQPPPVADIWQAVDSDNDGVAEYLALWLSLGVNGSEPTGLFFSPNTLTRAIVAVQHPNSGNDAIYEINYAAVVAPVTPPVAPPVTAPVSPPVAAPVTPPVTPPVAAPVKVPVPVALPVKAPVPVVAPVKAPAPVPVVNVTASPTRTPTTAPVKESCGLFGLNILCLSGCGFFRRLFNAGSCE